MQKDYDPHKSTMKYGKLHLKRAKDISYILNFWDCIGSTRFPEVPSCENLPEWKEGLNV